MLSHFFNPLNNPHQRSQPKTTRIQDIQNVALILGVKKLDPSHLNLTNLQEKGIIDQHWKVKSTAPKSSKVRQLDFNTGVTLMGFPNSIIFRETMIDNRVDTLKTPQIINRYLHHFEQTVYQTFTFNLQRIFNLPNQQNFLYNYTKAHLLANDLLQNPSLSLLQVDISGKYQLERCQMTFRTKVGNLDPVSSKKIPFLLFFAGFHYRVSHFYPQERVNNIHQCLNNIPLDHQQFKELVEHQFLG